MKTQCKIFICARIMNIITFKNRAKRATFALPPHSQWGQFLIYLHMSASFKVRRKNGGKSGVFYTTFSTSSKNENPTNWKTKKSFLEDKIVIFKNIRKFVWFYFGEMENLTKISFFITLFLKSKMDIYFCPFSEIKKESLQKKIVFF